MMKVDFSSSSTSLLYAGFLFISLKQNHLLNGIQDTAKIVNRFSDEAKQSKIIINFQLKERKCVIKTSKIKCDKPLDLNKIQANLSYLQLCNRKQILFFCLKCLCWVFGILNGIIDFDINSGIEWDHFSILMVLSNLWFVCFTYCLGSTSRYQCLALFFHSLCL